MERDELVRILESNAAIKLIRSRKYVFTTCFLNETFADTHNYGINSSDFHVKLEMFLERNYEYFFNDETEYPEEDYLKEQNFNSLAKTYIKEWITNEYITSFQKEDGEIFYELSTPVSKALAWFDKLKKKEFIGTDSKLKNILNMSDSAVVLLSTSPEEKLNLLEKQKKEIEAQILDLKINGTNAVIDDYNVESICEDLTEAIKDFMTDFNIVKNNFAEHIRDIYQKQLENKNTNEIIIGSMDYLDKLNSTSQGKSFEAFWNMISSKETKDRYESNITNLYQILKKKGSEGKFMFLKNSLVNMQHESYSVWQKKNKMMENLCSLVTQRNLSETENKSCLFRENARLMIEVLKNGIIPDIGISLDDNDIQTYFESTLTIEEEKESAFEDAVEEEDNQMDSRSASGLFFNPHAVNLEILRERINAALEENENGQISLFDIFEEYPIEKGLNEIFGYFNLMKEYVTTKTWNESKPVTYNEELQKFIQFPKIIIVCPKK